MQQASMNLRVVANQPLMTMLTVTTIALLTSVTSSFVVVADGSFDNTTNASEKLAFTNTSTEIESPPTDAKVGNESPPTDAKVGNESPPTDAKTGNESPLTDAKSGNESPSTDVNITHTLLQPSKMKFNPANPAHQRGVQAEQPSTDDDRMNFTSDKNISRSEISSMTFEPITSVQARTTSGQNGFDLHIEVDELSTTANDVGNKDYKYEYDEDNNNNNVNNDDMYDETNDGTDHSVGGYAIPEPRYRHPWNEGEDVGTSTNISQLTEELLFQAENSTAFFGDEFETDVGQPTQVAQDPGSDTDHEAEYNAEIENRDYHLGGKQREFEFHLGKQLAAMGIKDLRGKPISLHWLAHHPPSNNTIYIIWIAAAFVLALVVFLIYRYKRVASNFIQFARSQHRMRDRHDVTFEEANTLLSNAQV